MGAPGGIDLWVMRRPLDVSSDTPWSSWCCLTLENACPSSRSVPARPAYSPPVSVTSTVTSHELRHRLACGVRPVLGDYCTRGQAAGGGATVSERILIKHIRGMRSSKSVW